MGIGDVTKRVVVEFVAEDEGASAAAAKLDKKVKGLGKTTDGATEKTDGLAESLGQMRGALVAVGAIAAATGAAVAFVGDETARLDKIAKDAQKGGLGTDAQQRLAHLATLSGTAIEAVSKASLKLELNLGDVADGGGKKAAEVLGELGLEAEALASMGETERLKTLAGAFSELDDGAHKSALAMDLLGKSGTDLIPLLNAGADGVEAMNDAVGHIFTREELARAEAYQDALAELDKAAQDTKGTLAIGLAPAFQEVAESMTETGVEAGDVMPAISLLLSSVMKGLGPPLKMIGSLARQLGALGRVVEVVAQKVSRIADGAIAAGSELLESSGVTEWAEEATEALGGVGGGLGGLADDIKKNIPLANELAMSWGEVERALTGAHEASELGLIGDTKAAIASVKLLARAYADEQAEAKQSAEERSAALENQADAIDREAEILEASGARQAAVNAKIFEALELRRQAAAAAGDEAAQAQATHDLTIAQLKAGKSGGRGPSAADRIRAADTGAVQDLQHMADIQAAIAVSAEEIFEAEEAGRQAKLAAIELDERALEATRARGQVARQEQANALQGLDQDADLILIESRVAARDFAEQQLAEQLERQELLAQEAHDLELARIEEEADARRALDEELARLADAEAKRKRAAFQLAKDVAGASNQILSQGQAFASQILDATIKDDDKRARADMRMRGLSALATGALEFVNMAAAIASFNPVSAVAHGAAGAFAVASGVALIAGNIPGGGAAAVSAPAAEPVRSDRDTSTAPTVPDSVPAADQEPSQRLGGAAEREGATVINIGSINANGSIDPAFAEGMVTALENAGFSRGAA